MRSNGFTITELIIVAIVLSLIIGVALPNFGRSRDRAYERDAEAQLAILHQANKLYFSRERTYLPTALGSTVSNLNNNLNISLTENDATFEYNTTNSDQQYTACLNYPDFSLQISEANNSLCCETGTCPTNTTACTTTCP